MHRVSKLQLSEINSYLICQLCNGYFIDPCTIQECTHSFCKTCIVNHLYYKGHTTCPTCNVVIHKTRPLDMIRNDQTLQDLVYKLVPGVFKNEMERRRKFYAEHPGNDPASSGNPEERGEVKADREILAEDDHISMALVHSPNGDAKPAVKKEGMDDDENDVPVIYLRCPAACQVSSLRKLIRNKFDVPTNCLIDIFHSDESLGDDYTLMDIAYIYTWRRRGPLKVFYTIYQFDPSAARAASSKDSILEESKETGEKHKNIPLKTEGYNEVVEVSYSNSSKLFADTHSGAKTATTRQQSADTQVNRQDQKIL